MTNPTPLRTTSEQSWQERLIEQDMNDNAVRGRDEFAQHAAQLAREAADRRAAFRRAFGQENDS